MPPMLRKPKSGRIFRPKYRRRDGSVAESRVWWIEYWHKGVPHRESSKSLKWDDADLLLKRRLGEIVTGKFAGLGPERIPVRQLLDNLVEDYKLQKRGSLKDLVSRIKRHIRPTFGDMRAAEVGTGHVKRYIQSRLRAGAANATVNRELSVLHRAFRLAAEEDPPLVSRVLQVQFLPEDNTREGFLEREQYEGLLKEMPDYLKPVFVYGYNIGCREGELLRIERSHVDWIAKEVNFPHRNTKNKAGKVAPIYGDMVPWTEMLLTTEKSRWLFDRRGRQMHSFRKAWNGACVRAGLGQYVNRDGRMVYAGILFHDLRRTACRNMIRAGVPERVAMAISGHKTRSTFDRYNVTSGRDIREAGAKMESYLAEAKDGLRTRCVQCQREFELVGEGNEASGRCVCGAEYSVTISPPLRQLERPKAGKRVLQ